jgi:hypothetical protein
LRRVLAIILWALPVLAAASPVLLKDFQLHALDADILKTLGFDELSSVVYLRELGSITKEQLATRDRYEPIGCQPFIVLRNGKQEESGFNCRSFFCVGYDRGLKICHDLEGKPYGGVVEMGKRLGQVTINEEKKPFKDFKESERSPSMQKRIDALAAVKCEPFYLMLFDIAVGEGYTCEEIGRGDQFSPRQSCIDDWRTPEGITCDQTVRDNELEWRANFLHVPNPNASGASSSSQSSAPAPVPTFPDVIQGQYGYTAITSLARDGVIRGYADGTFKPKNIVNRAEFTTLLLRGLNSDEVRVEANCFPDVGEQWFAAAVCAAKRLNWVRGYADGAFRPARTITKAEGLKIVMASILEGQTLTSNAALPPGVDANAWYAPYVRKAVELGILLEGSFQPQLPAMRADAAVWIYRARKYLGTQVSRGADL